MNYHDAWREWRDRDDSTVRHRIDPVSYSCCANDNPLEEVALALRDIVEVLKRIEQLLRNTADEVAQHNVASAEK